MTGAPSPGEDGFALTEVLVGFAILALVSLGMMRAFGGTMDTLRAVSASERRLDLAERLVAERRAETTPRAGRREGIEDGLAWATTLEPLPLPGSAAAAPRLLRLVVAVGRPSETEPAPVLTTLVTGGLVAGGME